MTTGRTSWYSDHPIACTCFDCDESRRLHMVHGKIGRNERCPCGSGKKYKKCHGK